MIFSNDSTRDLEDVAVLFSAVCKHAECFGDEVDATMVTRGYAAMLEVCGVVADILAETDTGPLDEWDGCVWFERLEDWSQTSLAARLFQMEEHYDGHIRYAVRLWLEDKGVL